MKGQSKFFKMILFLGDIFVMCAALFLALVARNENLSMRFGEFFYSFVFLYVFWLILIFILNLYDLYFFKKTTDFFFSVAIFSVLAFLSGVVYFYFRPHPEIAPKTILILNVIIFGILFTCWRCVFRLFMESNGIKSKIVIIGNRPQLGKMMPQISKNYEVMAFFCPGNVQAPEFIPKQIFISDFKQLADIILQKKVESVLLAFDPRAEKDYGKTFFSDLPPTLSYIDFDDLCEQITRKISLEQIDEAWFLQKASKPENKLEQIVKRLFDIIFSSIALVLYALFFPLLAILIKIDSKGPVLYCHQRVGKGGKQFTLCKFRNMTASADQYSKVWRERDENNITKVGKFLRRTHLDELPQAWNLFRGDLSFVGPRPEWSELAKVFEKEIPFYSHRYLVKPGLLGWAQINFPASKSVHEAKGKFEYDLYYIKNHSLLLDAEIILKAARLFFW